MQNTGIDITFIIFIVFAIMLIVSLIMNIITLCKLKKLQRKCDKFTRGKDAESLEDTIFECLEKVDDVERVLRVSQEEILNLRKNQKLAIQKIGLVKYDAFFDMRGQQSYIIALLDQRENGFIINSFYSREGNYSYMKEIKEGVCSLELSPEEEEALERAKNKA